MENPRGHLLYLLVLKYTSPIHFYVMVTYHLNVYYAHIKSFIDIKIYQYFGGRIPIINRLDGQLLETAVQFIHRYVSISQNNEFLFSS